MKEKKRDSNLFQKNPTSRNKVMGSLETEAKHREKREMDLFWVTPVLKETSALV